MPLGMKMLALAVALTLLQMLGALFGAMLQVGLPALAGNREGLPPITGWAGRMQRAHRNMLESLVLFASLALVAQVTGKVNPWTDFGALLFFWARVGYAVVYMFGVPWLRTGVWAVSLAGLAIMAFELM